MMNHSKITGDRNLRFGLRLLGALVLAWTLTPVASAQVAACPAPPPGGEGTINLKVIKQDNTAMTRGYRWIVEEDTTYAVTPGTACGADSLAVNLHKSYMPVVKTDHVDAPNNSVEIKVPDSNKRYYVSVLPDQPDGADACASAAGQCFTQSGRQAVFAGSNSITVNVVVTPQPLPTAQIWVRAFEDTASINNAWDTGEAGLGGFLVFIYDMGGQLATDTFGNPLGTLYNADGSIKKRGDGTVRTMTLAEVDDPAKNPFGLAVGEALIQNIAPAKYGVQIIPKAGEGWQQTHTIEGTKGIDAWVLPASPAMDCSPSSVPASIMRISASSSR